MLAYCVYIYIYIYVHTQNIILRRPEVNKILNDSLTTAFRALGNVALADHGALDACGACPRLCPWCFKIIRPKDHIDIRIPQTQCFLECPFSWSFAPECRILVLMRSLGPLLLSPDWILLCHGGSTGSPGFPLRDPYEGSLCPSCFLFFSRCLSLSLCYYTRMKSLYTYIYTSISLSVH